VFARKPLRDLLPVVSKSIASIDSPFEANYTIVRVSRTGSLDAINFATPFYIPLFTLVLKEVNNFETRDTSVTRRTSNIGFDNISLDARHFSTLLSLERNYRACLYIEKLHDLGPA